MKIHVTGRQLRLTDAIHSYVGEKVSRAQKHFNHIVWAQVFLSVEKRAHRAEIVIHASKQTFRALASAATLYAAIDLASDKIDAQLRKYKERLKSRHRSAPKTPESLVMAMEPSPVRFSVVKQVSVEPMSPEFAAQEMERKGYDFWMFQNKEARQINVIFRRLDDSFGLIQPAKKGRR